MRRLTLEKNLSRAALLDALTLPSALELELHESPASLGRLELLDAVCSFDGSLVTVFSGPLATPLVEVACLSQQSEWTEGSTLDFEGALLSPLVFRLGARPRFPPGFPSRVDPAAVLSRAGARHGKSPLALALVESLLCRSRGPRVGMAREKAAFGLVMAAPDKREGVRAFREKRLPRFGM